MSNCNNNCGCNHGCGVVPGPCISINCGKGKADLRIRTETIPAGAGTDDSGQPYAPKLGRYFNTIVTYQSTGNVYFYDSAGVYTLIGETRDWSKVIANLQTSIENETNRAEGVEAQLQNLIADLQTNINQLANKETEDVENLQANINEAVNEIGTEKQARIAGDNQLGADINAKQDKLISGTNIKTINGESVLGEGDMTIGGGGADYLYQYTLSADNLNQLLYNVTTDSSVVIRGNVVEKGDEESGANIPLTTLPVATTTKAGVMSAADKAKLDSLSGGGGSTPENLKWVFGGNNDTPKQVSIVSATFNTAPSLGLSIPYFDYADNEVKTGNIDVFPFATTDRAGLMSASDKTKLDGLSASTNLTSVPTASYTADNVNLAFGDENVELAPAVGSAEGKVSQAGIMSAFQASQLEALAAAYEAEEKGTTLYEGTASVNNIELSESGLSYDHLIVVAQYMGMGSFALEQQVSAVFYPTDSVKAFQMNATDITTGNAPMVQLIQDIWSITDDGMEIELASSLKATVNSETTVEPDTTSNFTITKVVGFGKKLAES